VAVAGWACVVGVAGGIYLGEMLIGPGHECADGVKQGVAERG